MINIKIKENDANQRVDRFLQKLMPNAGKNFLMRMLREKKIKVNKKKCEPSYLLLEGDDVTIYFSDETFEKFSKGRREVFNKTKIEIVYEDENVIIIDKPAGLLCHVSNNLKEPNVVDGVINYLREKGEYNPRDEHSFVPAISNRLDRNTAGLVIAAKNANTLRTMNELIKNREIQKLYHAIVRGKMDFNGILKNSFEKNEKKNMVKVTKDGEKSMESVITTIKSASDFSLVKIELITGRTHQIRLQLKLLKHPIIGDNKYGDIGFNNSLNIKDKNHQRLVAGELVFPKLEGDLESLSDKSFKSKYLEELIDDYRSLTDE